jgi:DNA-binding NtrC family response regulator
MKTRPKLLLIDDGNRYIELLHHFLRDYDYATRCELSGPCWQCPQRAGCELTHAHDAAEADDALRRHPDVDVVLLDVAFNLPEHRLLPLRRGLLSPGGDGAAEAQVSEPDDERRRRLQGLLILGQLRRARGALPVVLMTSQEELGYEDAAEALFADEFVTLAGADALDARALGLLIERVLVRRREAPEAGGYLFGKSPAMARLRREAQILGRTSLPVLVLGETGTGKSALCEQVLHPAAPRTGPFVAVDLSALPESLLSAELFGTARGAYSGAVDRPGRFEHASGGTLLLDEIGNLPLEVQRMLLLVLQDGRVTRLGETTPRPVQVKLLAATNSDLAEAVRSGRFRADLYARLNPAARLHVPPLRERMEDLEILLRGLLRKTFASGPNRQLLVEYCDAAGFSFPPQAELVIGQRASKGHRKQQPADRAVRFLLQAESMTALRAHPFPGNIRELEMLIGNAAVFALADALSAAEERRAVPEAAHTIPIPPKLVRELLRESWPAPSGASSTSSSDRARPRLCPQPTLHAVAKDAERRIYEALYAETKGDFTAMARVLLSGDAAVNARRVRLRYNQLGLRVRGLKK